MHFFKFQSQVCLGLIYLDQVLQSCLPFQKISEIFWPHCALPKCSSEQIISVNKIAILIRLG